MVIKNYYADDTRMICRVGETFFSLNDDASRVVPKCPCAHKMRYRIHRRYSIPIHMQKQRSIQKQRSLEIALKTPEIGGYLLSHKRSTIGAAELNDPVRNGKGWDLSTITTSI